MSDAAAQRVVHLLVPYDHNGKRIESITLGPFLFDHDLKWNEGKFDSSLQLIVVLSGLDEGTIRQLRYPDASRVMAEFMALIPQHIANDITNGIVPRVEKAEPEFGYEPETGEDPPLNADDQSALNVDPGPIRSRPGAAGVKSRAFDPKEPWTNLDKGEETGPVEPPADEGGGFEGLGV